MIQIVAMKSKPAVRKATVTVSISLPREFKQDIDEAAESSRVPRAAWIRMACEKLLQENTLPQRKSHQR